MNLRKISSRLFSKPSVILREINSNALRVEWSKSYRTDNIFKHRFELFEYINLRVLDNEAIDYLEFGVHKGDSIVKWAKINKSEKSRFLGF